MIKFIHNYFIVALVALLSAIAFSACSDDKDKEEEDEDSPESELVIKNKIVGTWLVVHNKGWYTNHYGKELWDEPAEDEVIFKVSSNGKFEYQIDGSVDASGTWSIRDNYIVLDFYEDGSNFTEEYKISKLDANELILIGFESGKDEDGSYEYYEEVTLKKLK